MALGADFCHNAAALAPPERRPQPVHKLNAPRLVKLTLVLLSCSTLAVGTDWATATPAAPAGAAQSYCDGSVRDCKLPVKFLGEKDGCACFACEHGKESQRVICTRNDEDKRLMRKMELEKKPAADDPSSRR